MAYDPLAVLENPPPSGGSGFFSKRFKLSIKLLGVLLTFFSVAMLPPLVIELYYQDGNVAPFLYTFAIILIMGLALWLPTKEVRGEPRNRDGFLVVVLFWLSLSLVAALPLMFSERPAMNFTDAVFEATSGLTTTGATVLTGLDKLPHSILFYRAELHLLGGMGVVVLAVAILPMLGIGGMQLYRAETPGPMKDEKMTPRIAETAKQLWLIYLLLNVLCCLAFWAAGMTFFDAVAHAFATVATGGFSTHDASLGFYDSAAIEIVCGFFSLVGGINFALIYLAWRARSLRIFARDSEFKFFLLVYVLLIALVSGTLYVLKFDWWPALYHGFFQTVSIVTTNGLTSSGYPAEWPLFAVLLLVFGSFFGGCAGSTTGGIKAIRFLLLYRQSIRELELAIRPRAEIAIKLGNRIVSTQIIQAVWGFYFLYIFCFCMISLALTGMGYDLVTAFGSTAAAINNMGVGLGETSGNFGGLVVPAKWLLIFGMLLGRLEIFPLLLIFLPSFRY